MISMWVTSSEEALGAPFTVEARVLALMAPVFSAADLKTPVRDLLPLNAGVPALDHQGDYIRIGDGAWLHARHLLTAVETDFVTVAERFLGVPYVWGGRLSRDRLFRPDPDRIASSGQSCTA